MIHRLRSIVILAALSLLLLELVLQFGALAVAWTQVESSSAAEVDGRRGVLCVGDSFTYGLGASDPRHTSYPAALQQQLDEVEAGRWRVANEGLPGRNSRGVLERIDAQLARHRPSIVVILVGLNDRWSRPARLDLADEPDAAEGVDVGFRWEWRTLRLWRWLSGRPSTAVPWSHGLRGVAPFEPRLAADDPLRLRDRAGEVWPDDASDAVLRTAILDRGEAAILLPHWRAGARRFAAQEPALALRAAVRAFIATGDGDRFAAELRARAGGYEPKMLDTLLRELAPPRAAREAVAAAFAEALGWRQGDGLWIHPESGAQAVFADVDWVADGPELEQLFDTHRFHVEQIIARCRAAGAQALLLGYPNRISVPDVLFARIAARCGIDFLSTVDAFEDALGGRDRSALFVPDGHCNDAGYRLLASVVARWIGAR